MPTTTLTTITRSDLLKAVELAIAAAETEGPYRLDSPDLAVIVVDSLKAELRKVAQTMDKVAAYWWDPITTCGCVVGTMLHHRGIEHPEYGVSVMIAAEHAVGIQFIYTLRSVLTNDEPESPAHYHYNVLQVV